MEDKVYYFDFGSKRKKKISYVLGMLIFLVVSFGIDLFAFFVNFWLSGKIQNKEILPYLFYGMMSLAVVFKISGIVVQFFPRKIVLTDKTIEIKYNNFLWLSHKVFSLSIKYEKLESCELNNYPKSLYIGKGGIRVPFISYNWDSLVVLRKITFRTLAIPVENAEDFVAEVNRRIEAVKQ